MHGRLSDTSWSFDQLVFFLDKGHSFRLPITSHVVIITSKPLDSL